MLHERFVPWAPERTSRRGDAVGTLVLAASVTLAAWLSVAALAMQRSVSRIA